MDPPDGLISVSEALSQTPAYTARSWLQGLCIAWCACLLPAFAGNHFAYLDEYSGPAGVAG